MRHRPTARLLLAALLLVPCLTAFAADPPRPLKVFILAGQSNMEGQAVVDLAGKDYNDGKGTLSFLLRDPQKGPLVKHLSKSDGTWVVREDVWCRYQRENGPLLAGPLTMGFSVYGDQHHFGPELQFGNVLGDLLENQILLIKTAWGGKSLFKDFRPPSSGGDVGPYYTRMIAQIHETLANLKRDFPSYDGRGYELAGFVWYHGWNDGVDPKNAVPQYEQNLVNLIRDIRQEFHVPNLPVVIGELTGPWVQAPGDWATLRTAQRQAAERPEFKGTVLFVETHDFVRQPEDSPNPGHGHHEFGNAETYFLVGDSLGKAMVTLLTSTASKTEVIPAADPPPAKPMIGTLPAAKVLFLGNSITLHGPAPGIGWTGNWGMAASAADKDYVHLLTADITKAAGAKPETMVRNIADFERGYGTFEIGKQFKKELEFKADLIIVAIGENVAEPLTDESRAQYAAAFARLLSELKHQGNPAIFVRSSFWPNAAKDAIMRKASTDAGVTFVDIGKLGADKSNAAGSERKIEHDGVAGHPGDKGMRAIADEIFAAIRRRAEAGATPD